MSKALVQAASEGGGQTQGILQAPKAKDSSTIMAKENLQLGTSRATARAHLRERAEEPEAEAF